MESKVKKSIFRKTSLERISSPEQLNEYIKIVNPSLIAILVALFLILFGCSFWVFSGSIPKYVSLNGVSVTDDSGVQTVYCYVPISTAKRLSVGMAAEVSPEYAPKEQYGYLYGEIIDIGESVVTEEQLENTFENPSIVLPVLDQSSGNLIQIQVSLGDWSNENGKDISIIDGTVCTVSVIESEQKPYELIFNT